MLYSRSAEGQPVKAFWYLAPFTTAYRSCRQRATNDKYHALTGPSAGSASKGKVVGRPLALKATGREGTVNLQTRLLCDQCGNAVLRYPSKARPRTYCSRQCKAKAETQRAHRLCEQCGGAFFAKQSTIKNGGGRFCSLACWYRGNTRTASERFWTHVDKTDTCWFWTGAIDTGGYGCFYDGSRLVRAHRFSWELVNGPIEQPLLCLHRCDIYYPVGNAAYRRCVRPIHLFLGDHQDNHDDMTQKGRGAIGIRHGQAKLTESDVLRIRALRAEGATIREIAGAYGRGLHTIQAILEEKTWRHLLLKPGWPTAS